MILDYITKVEFLPLGCKVGDMGSDMDDAINRDSCIERE